MCQHIKVVLAPIIFLGRSGSSFAIANKFIFVFKCFIIGGYLNRFGLWYCRCYFENALPWDHKHRMWVNRELNEAINSSSSIILISTTIIIIMIALNSIKWSYLEIRFVFRRRIEMEKYLIFSRCVSLSIPLHSIPFISSLFDDDHVMLLTANEWIRINYENGVSIDIFGFVGCVYGCRGVSDAVHRNRQTRFSLLFSRFYSNLTA